MDVVLLLYFSVTAVALFGEESGEQAVSNYSYVILVDNCSFEYIPAHVLAD